MPPKPKPISRAAAEDEKYPQIRSRLRALKRALRHSVDWVVFEANGDALWAQARSRLEAVLLPEWQAGRLVGIKPEQAFFVRCDRTTMTQADIDRGRLIALVGMALLRPAEFTIFRIGQWTESRRPKRKKRPTG